MRLSIRRFSTAFVLSGIATAIPVALAFHTGAGPGYTGGPMGGGENCTACHEPPDHGTVGGVELTGVPQRYRAGQQYPLRIRIFDAEQVGAGFEISAETLADHVGDFLIADPVTTQCAAAGPVCNYATHTEDGYFDSLDPNWQANGGAYTYEVVWRAPGADAGRVTFFAAGNAVNDAAGFGGDRFYRAHRTIGFAQPGDADGDSDVDLLDAAALQQCYDPGTTLPEPCAYSDLTGDSQLDSADLAALGNMLTGPTALYPAGYVLADPIRGGLLYDRWWLEARLPAPTGTHPLYPPGGIQTGSTTFRCKECHGWDYKGRDGQYGAGTHYTGIRGVFGTTLSPQQIFDLLKADPVQTPNGHNMAAYGLSDADLWDVTRMVREGVVNTSTYITSNGFFIGNAVFGRLVYENRCYTCHLADGKHINFGTAGDPEYVGTVASDNPWEFLHKVRFGHPASPMQGLDLLGVSAINLANLGAYAASLPEQ
ncbi:MAG: hypothetical protein HY763_11175 [Planctomycetes bacterium]|nr:hypothetical protein [Planctomycetota bacterium]